MSVGTAVLVDDRLPVLVPDGLAEQESVDRTEDVGVGVEDEETTGATMAVAVPVRDTLWDTVVDASWLEVGLLVDEPSTDGVPVGVAVGAGVEVSSFVKETLALQDRVGNGVGVADILSLLVPDLLQVAELVDWSVWEEDVVGVGVYVGAVVAVTSFVSVTLSDVVAVGTGVSDVVSDSVLEGVAVGAGVDVSSLVSV